MSLPIIYLINKKLRPEKNQDGEYSVVPPEFRINNYSALKIFNADIRRGLLSSDFFPKLTGNLHPLTLRLAPTVFSLQRHGELLLPVITLQY